MSLTGDEPAIEARGLFKRFGHVEALRGVDFAAYHGQVTAIVGDNGAGKSTLVGTLCGVLEPDAGEVWVAGRHVRLGTPREAQRLGVEAVYQDLALAPDLDPTANAFLGREKLKSGVLGRLGVLDKAGMQREAAEVFESLNVRLPTITEPVASLSGGQRQGVAVARAVRWAKNVLFLDEPTAALGVVQRENVAELVRRVRDARVAVVLISHNMPEVLALADRIEVLRLGKRVTTFDRSASVEELVSAMTGGYEMTGRASS